MHTNLYIRLLKICRVGDLIFESIPVLLSSIFIELDFCCVWFTEAESAPDLSVEYKKKETPDNYSIYLQKKQDRIQQSQPTEPQTKKVKTGWYPKLEGNTTKNTARSDFQNIAKRHPKHCKKTLKNIFKKKRHPQSNN